MGDRSRAVHLSLNGILVHSLGWGGAFAKVSSVRIDLADPGEVVVIERRSIRDRQVAVLSITDIEMFVYAREYEQGGNWRGGGVGVLGVVGGVMTAAALNRMSYQRWEETHLRIVDTTANGARRVLVFSAWRQTPASLLDALMPARDAWSFAWVDEVMSGAIDPPGEGALPARYERLDRMVDRRVLAPGAAGAICALITQPFIDATRARLASGRVTHQEARRLHQEIDRLHQERRISDAQLDSVGELLAQVPEPAIAAERYAEDRALREHLRYQRSIGAIDQDQLERELTRLDQPQG